MYVLSFLTFLTYVLKSRVGLNSISGFEGIWIKFKVWLLMVLDKSKFCPLSSSKEFEVRNTYVGSIRHYLKSLTIKKAICSKCIRYVFFMFWRAREALQNIYSSTKSCYSFFCYFAQNSGSVALKCKKILLFEW